MFFFSKGNFLYFKLNLTTKYFSQHGHRPQIETIFELGDVDGDGTIDMEEFVGEE